MWSRSGSRVDQVPDEWSAHVGQALPEAVSRTGAVNSAECGYGLAADVSPTHAGPLLAGSDHQRAGALYHP